MESRQHHVFGRAIFDSKEDEDGDDEDDVDSEEAHLIESLLLVKESNSPLISGGDLEGGTQVGHKTPSQKPYT